MLFNFVYDIFWIYFVVGIGWVNRFEYYGIVSNDCFLVVYIRDYVILWFFYIGLVLFCYYYGDWSFCGCDDYDFEFLL